MDMSDSAREAYSEHVGTYKTNYNKTNRDAELKNDEEIVAGLHTLSTGLQRHLAGLPQKAPQPSTTPPANTPFTALLEEINAHNAEPTSQIFIKMTVPEIAQDNDSAYLQTYPSVLEMDDLYNALTDDENPPSSALKDDVMGAMRARHKLNLLIERIYKTRGLSNEQREGLLEATKQLRVGLRAKLQSLCSTIITKQPSDDGNSSEDNEQNEDEKKQVPESGETVSAASDNDGTNNDANATSGRDDADDGASPEETPTPRTAAPDEETSQLEYDDSDDNDLD